MITTSIKDLEAMLEGVGTHIKTAFEKIFIPAIVQNMDNDFGQVMSKLDSLLNSIYYMNQSMSRMDRSMKYIECY